jgi:glyoxalase family protein
VTSSAAENLAFYEKTLGLRLVKQTVNFDDPFTYHLYYGDANGSPGTILTFFPWGNLPRGKPGAGMVTAIAFAIPRTSIELWTRRIRAQAIRVERSDRFGDPVLQFADPHGLPIELIGTSDPPSTVHWVEGPIEKAHAVTGFHSATATVNGLEENNTLLRDVMGMTLHERENHRYRFRMRASEAPGRFLDVVYDPKAPLGRPGGGTVHHIAFRTENDTSQLRWQSILKKSGVGVTDVRDRKYFRSIYFHIPAGVLFEIATDPPGFSVDESEDKLGSSLKLPEQYEPMRSDIERRCHRCVPILFGMYSIKRRIRSTMTEPLWRCMGPAATKTTLSASSGRSVPPRRSSAPEGKSSKTVCRGSSDEWRPTSLTKRMLRDGPASCRILFSPLPISMIATRVG